MDERTTDYISMGDSLDGDMHSIMHSTTPQYNTVATVETMVSSQVREIFEIVNCVAISATIGVFGIFFNIVNIMVFAKQGSSDVITISLLALSVSDLLALVALEINDFLINPFILSMDLPFSPSGLRYIIAALPHSCFTEIGCLLTSFVTLERCICISFPLKVKSILSPSRVSIAVVLIFLCVFISFVPAYLAIRLRWTFDLETNRTVLGIHFVNDIKNIADITFIVNCVMIFIAFGSVIVTTVILVIKLKEQSIWRNSIASSGKEDKDSPAKISSKDMKLIQMVVAISTVVIVCCSPGMSCFLVSLAFPSFNGTGKYRNIYKIAWSFSYVAEAVNHSVNIFIYYSMSSKYQQTIRQLFPNCFNGEQIENNSSVATSSTQNDTTNCKSSNY